MKLFVPRGSAWTDPVEALSPVLQVHWDGVPVRSRSAGVAHSDSPFSIVDSMQDASVCVLPYEWSHYLRTSTMDQARTLGLQAASAGRSLLVWHSGDLPPVIPIANAVTFQPGLYRSRLRTHEYAAPSFESDPLGAAGDAAFTVRPKRPAPTVGFCGYAGIVPLKIAYSTYRAAAHNLKHLLGLAQYEAMPLVPATVLRAKVLRSLIADSRVDTDFVINTRAFRRHDARTATGTRAAQMASFRQNVLGTDYTICIRGYGNWSRRFYETLACGRIPVFIDTDCVLPGGNRIDWREYCVWIEPGDRARVAQRILEFHQRHDARSFAELQWACRRLWQDWLTPTGFMRHLPDTLTAVASVNTGQASVVPGGLSGVQVPNV